MDTRGLGNLIGGLAAMTALALLGAAAWPVAAHEVEDDTRRTAVVSAFAPELSILKGELDGATVYLEVFFRLAAGNAAAVVKALLRAIPE